MKHVETCDWEVCRAVSFHSPAAVSWETLEAGVCPWVETCAYWHPAGSKQTPRITAYSYLFICLLWRYSLATFLDFKNFVQTLTSFMAYPNWQSNHMRLQQPPICSFCNVFNCYVLILCQLLILTSIIIIIIIIIILANVTRIKYICFGFHLVPFYSIFSFLHMVPHSN